MIGAMAGSATPPSSSSGWAALRAADWEAARAAMEAELAHQETAAALDGLARARWWLSDIPGAIEAWERAFIAYRRADLDEPAAHVAVLLSRDHAEGLGNGAVANGRLARAKDLLGGQPDSIEWGWVTLVESERAGQPDLLSFLRHLLGGYEDLPEAVQAVVALHLARGQTALAAVRLHRRLNEIGRDTSSPSRSSPSWARCSWPSRTRLARPRRPSRPPPSPTGPRPSFVPWGWRGEPSPSSWAS